MFNNIQEAKGFLQQNSDNIPNLSEVDGEKLLDLSMKDVDLASMIMERGLRLGKGEDNPLRYAISKKELGLANSLVEKGINLDVTNKFGQTALMTASFNGYTEIAKALIEKGANVDAVNENRSTALMLASYNGHTEIAKALIEEGANVDVANNLGNTALILAYKNGHAETVKVLIDKGADVNHSNKEGNTALMLAAEQENIEVVNALVYEGVDINAKNSNGNTALHFAMSNNSIDAMKLLIENGASLKLKNNKQELPITVANEDTWYGFLMNEGTKLIEASEYCDALLSEKPPALNYNLEPEDVTSILINKLARSGNLDEFVKKYENRNDISFLFTDEMKDLFKDNVIELREKIAKNSLPHKIYDSLIKGEAYENEELSTFSQKTQKEIARGVEGLCRRNGCFTPDTIPGALIKQELVPVIIKNIEDTNNLEQNLRRFLDKELKVGYMDFKDLLNDENFNDLKNEKMRENPGDYKVSFSDFLSTNAYNEDEFKNKSELDRITYAAKEEKTGEYLADPQLIDKIKNSKNVELVEFMDEFLKNSDKFIVPKSFKDKVPELKEIIDQKMIEIKRQGKGPETNVTYVKLEDNGLTQEVQGRVGVPNKTKEIGEALAKAKQLQSTLSHRSESQGTAWGYTPNKNSRNAVGNKKPSEGKGNSIS